MQFISNINQSCHNYYNAIPKNTGAQMVLSFAIGSVIPLIITRNVKIGLYYGALAATATAIHGFVSPLFQRYAQPRTTLAWYEETCRTSIAIIATSGIAMAFGNQRIINNLFNTILIYAFITFLEPQRHNVNRAAEFGVIG